MIEATPVAAPLPAIRERMQRRRELRGRYIASVTLPPRLAGGVLLILASLTGACERPIPEYRGTGMPVDTLPLRDVVSIYRAALAGSFDVRDPTLSILIDPVYLPRSSDLAGGDTIPSDVIAALRATGVVQGTCALQVERMRVPLVCRAERAGYVARFSPPFALGVDSVQVHLVVQQYAIPGGPVEQRLRFERAYRVAREGTSWRALSEARLPQP